MKPSCKYLYLSLLFSFICFLYSQAAQNEAIPYSMFHEEKETVSESTAYEEYLSNDVEKLDSVQFKKYVYYLQDKEGEKAQKKLLTSMMAVMAIMAITFMALLTWIFYDRFKKADRNAKYMTAINQLKDYIRAQKEETDPDLLMEKNDEIKSLSEIKNNIISGIPSSVDDDIDCLVNPVLKKSDLYKELNEKIQAETCISVSEEDRIWKGIEELVEAVSPGFEYRLTVLTEGKMTPNEYKIALLIKFGFSNKQCSILYGRGKSTISTHRRNLSEKITGEKKADSNLDRLIISL